MSNNTNIVVLSGRVGGDIELKTTSTGKNYANFSICVNKSYKNQNGEKIEKPNWIRIKVWGKLAELCAQYSGKGRLINVTGELETSQYKDQQGNDKYATDVVASTVEFLDRPKESGVQPVNVNQAQTVNNQTVAPQVNNNFKGDDIPF